MIAGLVASRFATKSNFRLGLLASELAVLTCTLSGAGAEEKKPSPCTEDAMIVFDASGSMSGNQTLGIPNSRRGSMRSARRSPKCCRRPPRIGGSASSPTARARTISATSSSTSSRRPTPPAIIMNAVNGLVPAGKTPLTSAVEQAAEVLDYREQARRDRGRDRRRGDVREIALRRSASSCICSATS